MHFQSGGTSPLPMNEIVKRFFAKIEPVEECLELPITSGHRYPVVSIGAAQVSANRFSYTLFIGKIPDGLMVLHKCDNPKCIEPSHLFTGTGLDNMRDRLLKGRYNTVPRGSDVNTSKLSAEQVKEIRFKLSCGAGLRPLGREYGVTHKAIYLIREGKNWKHL